MPDNFEFKTYIQSLSDILYNIHINCEGYSKRQLEDSLKIIKKLRAIKDLRLLKEKILSDIDSYGWETILIREDLYVKNITENTEIFIKGPITLEKICKYIDKTANDDYDYGVHSRFLHFYLVNKKEDKIYIDIEFERIFEDL
jgi:hypothetical protein